MRIKVPLDDEGNLAIKKGSKKRYCILSSETYARYYREPVSDESKKVQVRYEAVKNACNLVAEWKEYNRNSYSSVLNTYYNVDETIRFLQGGPAGTTISIYEVPQA